MKLFSTLVLALVLAGCTSTAPTPAQPVLAASGQSLVAVGNTFVQVGALYTPNCLPTAKAPTLVDFCASFKAFAPKFQQAYPLAVATWKSAVNANDQVAAQQAEAAILSLATDLTTLAAQAYLALGGK